MTTTPLAVRMRCKQLHYVCRPCVCMHKLSVEECSQHLYQDAHSAGGSIMVFVVYMMVDNMYGKYVISPTRQGQPRCAL